jgi:hypothetical protein
VAVVQQQLRYSNRTFFMGASLTRFFCI